MLPKEMIESTGCRTNEYSEGRVSHGMGFYMIVDCPHGQSETMLRQHCALAIDMADQLVSHYIPVVIGGVVYGNVFCAQCLGADISQGQFWKLVLDGIRGLEEKCSDLRKNIPYKPVRWKLLTTYCIPKVTPWPFF